MPTPGEVIGLLMWVGLFYLAWRARRKHRQRAGARSSTVSRNPDNPKWQQDAPMPECFDEMDEESDL